MDTEIVETLVSHLMSSENERRTEAEVSFNIFREKHPDSLSLNLAHLLQSSPHFDIRAMSAILLRKQLTRDDSYIWPRLSSTTHSALKSLLLVCVEREYGRSIGKKLCDTVSELASGILPHGEWPELLPFMFKCVSSDRPRLQESALFFFSQLPRYMGETLTPHLANLHRAFLQCLSRTAKPEVRMASFCACMNFIQFLSRVSDRDKFVYLLPSMMQTLIETLNSAQESIAQEALELLIELAVSEPKLLIRQSLNVVGSMLQIAEAKSLGEGTHQLVVELLTSLVEVTKLAPEMNWFWPQYGRLFTILLELVQDIIDDPTWNTADYDDADVGNYNSNYSIGLECLNRLSVSLGGNTLVPVALDVLPRCFDVPKWQNHHAGLLALVQITKEGSKALLPNLELVVNMVLNSFRDPHPRVRWAAIYAVGQLSLVLASDLQVNYHGQVLPALALAMDDFQNPRVQARAASTVMDFCKNCTTSIVALYSDKITEKLAVLLQNDKQMVQLGALTAFISVADSSQEQFQKNYTSVMHYLKAILMNAYGKYKHLIHTKSMACISLVGVAVDQDLFRGEVKQVMDILINLQAGHIKTDDSTSCMLQASRLCRFLGQDFFPYMSVVMPALLQLAELKPDAMIGSLDSDADIDVSDDERCKDQAAARYMLCIFADQLKEGFYPWIDQVVATFIPLLTYYFHEEVRIYIFSAMPVLLSSAKLAIEKGQAPGHNEAYIKQLSADIISAVVEALRKEPETVICASMLFTLNECVQACGSHVDESQMRCIVDGIKQVITASSTRKRDLAERDKAVDFDEGELLMVFYEVGDCLGTLIKTFKASFLPFFDEISTYIRPMRGKDKTAEERRTALCIFDDVAEHCGEAGLKYYNIYLPFLFEACDDVNAGVREAGIYGIYVCAKFGGSVFRPYVLEALNRLSDVVGNCEALLSENARAYRIAVSALETICQFHCEGIDSHGEEVVPEEVAAPKETHEQTEEVAEEASGKFPEVQFLCPDAWKKRYLTQRKKLRAKVPSSLSHASNVVRSRTYRRELAGGCSEAVDRATIGLSTERQQQSEGTPIRVKLIFILVLSILIQYSGLWLSIRGGVMPIDLFLKFSVACGVIVVGHHSDKVSTMCPGVTRGLLVDYWTSLVHLIWTWIEVWFRIKGYQIGWVEGIGYLLLGVGMLCSHVVLYTAFSHFIRGDVLCRPVESDC